MWIRSLKLRKKAQFENFYRNYRCELCKREVFDDSYFCEACRAKLPYVGKYVCPLCGRKTFEGAGICLECKAHAPIYARARSPFVYEGEIRRLLLGMKRGKRYLSVLFGREMVPLVASFPHIDALLPVPVTERVLRRRGYNQAELLADYLSERSGIPCDSALLVKRREGKEQKGLSKSERRKNVRGIYTVSDRKSCRGKNFLLIDDVMTTGSTADELTRVLLAAGARRVYLLTAASTPLKD